MTRETVLARERSRGVDVLGATGVAAAFALCGLLLGQPAHGDAIYVGASEALCGATSIPAALDLASATTADDEIRLTRTLAYTGVQIQILEWDSDNTGDLVISGGWDDCLDGVPQGRTTLTGTGAGFLLGVMGTTGAPQALEVTLRDLELTGGVTGIGSIGETRLLVEGSRIHGNERGGIAAGGGRLEIDAATVVEENANDSLGGGLACFEAGSRLVVAGTVRANAAENAGGGIGALDGCVVELRAGATIEHNSAERGGGMALGDGAWAEGGGAGVLPVRIAHNIATLVGGGIYLVGPAPRSLLGNVQIDSNSAEAGAGVYVAADVVLQLERFNFESCANPDRCTTLSRNRTTAAGGLGSAALVSDGAELRMMQGFIEENGGDGEASLLLAAYGTAAIVLEGVQIWGNDTESIFSAVNGGNILAGFVTAAANRYWDEVSESFVDSAGASAVNASSIEIYTSILTDHEPFEATAGSTIVGDCLMVETEEGIEAEVSMVGVDPRFRNAAAGDLHLRFDSPAIDSCDTEVYTPLDIDFDLDPRGSDSPTRPNVLGPFDRGADESPLLFASGFEAGNLTGWSAAQP